MGITKHTGAPRTKKSHFMSTHVETFVVNERAIVLPAVRLLTFLRRFAAYGFLGAQVYFNDVTQNEPCAI